MSGPLGTNVYSSVLLPACFSHCATEGSTWASINTKVGAPQCHAINHLAPPCHAINHLAPPCHAINHLGDHMRLYALLR